jgi:hypothetical protein
VSSLSEFCVCPEEEILMSNRPSELIMSEEGVGLQLRLWDEAMNKLEAIQPGIRDNV